MQPMLTESVDVSTHYMPTAVPGAICILTDMFTVVFGGRCAITPITGEENELQGNGVLCAHCHTVNKWKNRQSFSELGLVATRCCPLSQ